MRILFPRFSFGMLKMQNCSTKATVPPQSTNNGIYRRKFFPFLLDNVDTIFSLFKCYFVVFFMSQTLEIGRFWRLKLQAKNYLCFNRIIHLTLHTKENYEGCLKTVSKNDCICPLLPLCEIYQEEAPTDSKCFISNLHHPISSY